MFLLGFTQRFSAIQCKHILCIRKRLGLLHELLDRLIGRMMMEPVDPGIRREPEHARFYRNAFCKILSDRHRIADHHDTIKCNAVFPFLSADCGNAGRRRAPGAPIALTDQILRRQTAVIPLRPCFYECQQCFRIFFNTIERLAFRLINQNPVASSDRIDKDEIRIVQRAVRIVDDLPWSEGSRTIWFPIGHASWPHESGMHIDTGAARTAVIAENNRTFFLVFSILAEI